MYFWLCEMSLFLLFTIEAEQDNDAFNGRVLQLVQQLMTDVDAAQKLVAVSMNSVN